MATSESPQAPIYTAFAGSRLLARGALPQVALAAKQAADAANHAADAPVVLVFDDASSVTVELDYRGTADEFAARLSRQANPCAANPPATHAAGAPEPEPRGPGRPRLGVVAREVTLLPRHWEWLATQPGGASVALRKLVEVALRTSQTKDKVRQASERGYKFMSTMAEHLPAQMPGFDEASRALFAGDQGGFEAATANWPPDVQTQLRRLLSDAFWWF